MGRAQPSFSLEVGGLWALMEICAKILGSRCHNQKVLWLQTLGAEERQKGDVQLEVSAWLGYEITYQNLGSRL